MLIAVDGTAASGKGTLARKIAQYYGYHYLDTGELYRAVARDCKCIGLRPNDLWGSAAVARGFDPQNFQNHGLREPDIADAAAIVAQNPRVRAALFYFQRQYARLKPGAVLDGRDIGTVVYPKADIKLFVDATPEERAKRRYLEYQKQGVDTTYEEVLNILKNRDAQDATRKTAPMKIAEDALLLNTTELDIDAAFGAAMSLINSRIC